MFPFTYKGKTYNECTRDGDAYKIEWCATTSSYDRDKKWGHCVKDKELRNCEDRHKNCEREALSGRCLLSAEVNRACSRSCGMCTFGGNAEGRPCVLPFIYRNKVSNECVEYENKRWCATTSNFDVDKKWGYCFPKGELMLPLSAVVPAFEEMGRMYASVQKYIYHRVHETSQRSKMFFANDALPFHHTRVPSVIVCLVCC